MGNNYKIPLPGPTPEIREKLHKNYKNCVFGVIVTLFGAIFPIFEGRTGKGNFVIFPHFSGISALVASRPSKGKNNSEKRNAKKKAAAGNSGKFCGDFPCQMRMGSG